MSNVIIAAVQMTSTNDKEYNLGAISRLVTLAAEKGASFVCLPECCTFMGCPREEKNVTASADGSVITTETTQKKYELPNTVIEAAEGLDGRTVRNLCDIARNSGVWMSVGGFPEQTSKGNGKVYNTHFIIDPEGSLIDPVYRKIHLFDSPLSELMESKTTEAGSCLSAVDMGFAVAGLTVCYDLRFPDLYGALCRPAVSSGESTTDTGPRSGGSSSESSNGNPSSNTAHVDGMHGLGAEIVLVPSAFTVKTGEAHWLTLLRARAIENQCYVVAAAQVGKHNARRESFGETCIIDPWGTVGKRKASAPELSSLLLV
jgi:deaminated glutathione amidase